LRHAARLVLHGKLVCDVLPSRNYIRIPLFAKNLFDSRPNLSDEVPVSALAGDRYRYWVGTPRQVGIDVRYRF